MADSVCNPTRPASGGHSRLRAWLPRGAAQWLMAILWGLGPVGYPVAANLSTLLGRSDDAITVTYRVFTLMLALAIIAWATLGGRRKTPVTYVVAYVAFWLILIFRITYDLYFRDVYTQWSAARIYQYALGITLVPSLAYFVQPQAQTLRLIFPIAWVGALLGSIMSLRASSEGQAIAGRMWLDRLDPIAIGKSGVITCILAACSFLDTRHKTLLLANMGMFVIGLLVMLSGASRGPMVGWSIAMIALMLTGWRALRASARWRRLVAASLASVAVLLGLSYVQKEGYTPAIRALSMLSGDDVSTLQRTQHLQTAFELFSEKPFLGHTFVTPNGGYPHNLFAEAMMGTGIVGTIILSLLVLSSARASERVLFSQHHSRWVALWFIVEFVGTLFSGALYSNPGFWWSAVAVTTLERVIRSSYLLPR